MLRVEPTKWQYWKVVLAGGSTSPVLRQHQFLNDTNPIYYHVRVTKNVESALDLPDSS